MKKKPNNKGFVVDAADKPRAWSYSRFSTYRECPYRFKLQYLDKIPEGPKNEAMQRGDRIHKLAEAYTSKQIKKLPPELRLYREELAELRDADGDSERMWQLDREWLHLPEPFDRRIWLRIKTDHAVPRKNHMLQIIDYKTGRVKDRGYEEQLELYAAGAVSMYNGIEIIRVELWYLDHKVTPHREYTAAEATKLQKTWNARVKPMMLDTTFRPKPGDYCRFCPYSKVKGGPCKF